MDTKDADAQFSTYLRDGLAKHITLQKMLILESLKHNPEALLDRFNEIRRQSVAECNRILIADTPPKTSVVDGTEVSLNDLVKLFELASLIVVYSKLLLELLRVKS